jgi:hypothetical protein
LFVFINGGYKSTVEDPDSRMYFAETKFCVSINDILVNVFMSLVYSFLFGIAGIGLSDILKPDLVSPLIETLPIEQRLASYLPEVEAKLFILVVKKNHF